MRKRAAILAIGAVAAYSGWIGCQAASEPDRLFAEAEALRPAYEKTASQQAIAKYQGAQAGWDRRGNKRDAARAAQKIGATFEQLGLLSESLRSYLEALSLVRASHERLLESEILSDVGVAQSLAAESADGLQEAERHCQSALNMAQRAGGVREEAKALNCLGEVAYHRGDDLESALELHRRAEPLWDRAGDSRGRAETQLFQGWVNSDLNLFDRAQECFDNARMLWTELADERGEAITLIADARLKERRGEYQDALNKYDEALTLLEPMGDVIWEGASLTGKGSVHLYMGDTSAALKHWERALHLFETAALKNYSVDVLMSLGSTYLTAGDDAKALIRLERALTIANELGNKRWQAFTLRYIGVVHLFRSTPELAQQYLQRSLDLQPSVADPRLEGWVRADMGEAYELQNQHDRALRSFRSALALSRAAGDRVGEARGLFGLARASRSRNELPAASQYAQRALEVVESLRTAVENRDLRASYFASVHQYHELYVDVLMQRRKTESGLMMAASAFEASERARARSLLDSLTGAGVDLRAGVDPALLNRERDIQRLLVEWGQRQRKMLAAAAPDADLKTLAAEHRDLEDRYNQVQAEIRSRSPRYAEVARPQPLSLKDVQKQVLDRDTLLLEYALGEKRSYLWVVSNTDHSSYELAPRAEIETAAQKLYERLTARLTVTGDHRERRRLAEHADAEYWKEAARLSDLLLAPAAKRLAGKRLLVVADGALQYLPFAALPIPGKKNELVPMMVEHEIVSLPSASALAVLRRENRDRKPSAAVAVLADPVFEADDPRLSAQAASRPVEKASGLALALRDFGFMRDGKLSVPRLAATRQEADAIVGAAPVGTTLRAIDFSADRATALSPELAKYRIVHFATHGVFNSDDPALSGLILSMFDRRGQPQDGFLRLHDIYGMHLPVELVVLSACNTALGKPVRGEGLVGIVRGFMYAGASRVVASLWKVDDDATGALMGRFYEEMLKNNRSPAAALREAQLAMWQQDRWRPPFYWAAFALQGEWK